MRASQERFELAVRGAGRGSGTGTCTAAGFTTRPAGRRSSASTEHEIGDSLEDWARLLHPDERQWILQLQDDFLASTSATVTVEYRLRHKDGSYRWITAHGLAVRDQQGKAYRLVGSHVDITDRKRAEEALQRERHNLERILEASDHERQLIAYDIHDGLAQHLAGAMMHFEHAQLIRAERPQESAAAYEAGMELLRRSHVEARRLISGVRPPILDESGVVAAVAHLVYDFCSQTGPTTEYPQQGCLRPAGPGAGELHLSHRPGRADQRLETQRQPEDQRGPGAERRPAADYHSRPGRRFRPRPRGRRPFRFGGDSATGPAAGRPQAVIRSQPGQGTRIVVELPVVPLKAPHP